MRNCVIFPSSSTFCGSPSPTGDSPAPCLAFKALYTSPVCLPSPCPPEVSLLSLHMYLCSCLVCPSSLAHLANS